MVLMLGPDPRHDGVEDVVEGAEMDSATIHPSSVGPPFAFFLDPHNALEAAPVVSTKAPVLLVLSIRRLA